MFKGPYQVFNYSLNSSCQLCSEIIIVFVIIPIKDLLLLNLIKEMMRQKHTPRISELTRSVGGAPILEVSQME